MLRPEARTPVRLDRHVRRVVPSSGRRERSAARPSGGEEEKNMLRTSKRSCRNTRAAQELIDLVKRTTSMTSSF